jgi:hypothetical protein
MLEYPRHRRRPCKYHVFSPRTWRRRPRPRVISKWNPWGFKPDEAPEKIDEIPTAAF